MRRRRKSSPIIETASARLAGLESIDPPPDIGPELTVALYRAALADTHTQQEAYNTLLAEADEAKNRYERSEAKLNDLSERMLAAVGAKFGRDSDEYEMAGGRRKSERKRRSQTAPAGAPPATT